MYKHIWFKKLEKEQQNKLQEKQKWQKLGEMENSMEAEF